MNMYGKIIVIKRSGADGAHFPLTANACLFGRGQDCDIRIQMPTVENEQCVINVNDKGHVLMRNLSAGTPTLVNEKVLSDYLTALSHGDIITIVDRKFRFEFPVDSRFYPKSPRGKSPKSQRNSSIINDSVIGLKSPGKPEQKSPKPLSPRTDNVPVSDDYSKSPLKQTITTPLKGVLTEEVNTSANYSLTSSKLLVSPASFYNSTPKGLKRLSDVRQNKGTPLQKMTPGTSTQAMSSTPLSSPARKSGSGLKTKTHESLQKSISYLKRRSMPLFERDEETNADNRLPEESNKSMTKAKKRKSSSNFDMLSAKRKRVSFGPSLSPEHFDKTLPPKTPIKKGATPTRINQGRKSLLKRNSPKSPKKTTTPRKASPGAKALALTPDVKSLDSTPSKQSSTKKQPGKRLSTAASPLAQENLTLESKNVSTPVQSSVSAELVTPASSQKENRARSMSPRSIKSAQPATPVSNRKNRARSMSPTSMESAKPETPDSNRKDNRARSMSPTSIESTKPITPGSNKKENRARSMSPTLFESAEPFIPLSGRKEKGSSPKATLSSPSQSYLTDSPMLSQDLFSQRSPVAAEDSLVSQKSLSSEKKMPAARAKSEGTTDKKSIGRHIRSLGTSPIISPLVNKSTIKVKNVRLSGKSPVSAVHYEKTPIVKRVGKLSLSGEQTDLNSSLTGIKEFVETHRANRASTGLPKASDLFASPVTAATVDLWGISSNTRRRSLGRKSLAGTPKRRSVGASLTGMSSIFKSPENDPDVSKAVSLTKLDTPRPIPSGRKYSTPKDSAKTPSRLGDASFSGISHLFKTPGENSDIVDGNEPTLHSVEVVNTSVNVSGRKARPPKKSLGSASKDISFSGVSSLFRSPDHHLESPKSISSKKTTPKSNTRKIFSTNTSFPSPGVSDLFKTPVQPNNVSEVNSKHKSVGPNQMVQNTEKVSDKRSRTPKKFYDEVSPVSSKKKSKSSESHHSNTKSPLKTPKSPVQAEKMVEKIQSPPKDRNKAVALLVIHGRSATPKVAEHSKTPSRAAKVVVHAKTPSRTPKRVVHTKTPSRTPKSVKKTAAVSAKKTIRTWSDIVQTGVTKPTALVRPALLTSKVTAIKKKVGRPLKRTVKTPKTPRALARALAPSTGHAESPPTILVGKKVAMKSKTPIRLPRKGRKQAMDKVSRISVGNTSFTGLSDMYKTPEPAHPADESALYDQIPDTPNGPNEMFVSPLASVADKRRSTNLVGVRELFAFKKRQSMKLAGVRELMTSPKIPGTSQRSSLTPTAMTRLMKTPKGPRHVSKIPKPSPNITPSGLKRMMKVMTYVSPYGVENLFKEVENETPKSSKKDKPPKALQMNSPEAVAASTGDDNIVSPKQSATKKPRGDDKIFSPKQSATKKPRGGTKRKADVNDAQIPAKKIKASQETVEPTAGRVTPRRKGRKVSSPKKSAIADVLLASQNNDISRANTSTRKTVNDNVESETAIRNLPTPKSPKVFRKGRGRPSLAAKEVKLKATQVVEPQASQAGRRGREKVLPIINLDGKSDQAEPAIRNVEEVEKPSAKRGRKGAAAGKVVVGEIMNETSGKSQADTQLKPEVAKRGRTKAGGADQETESVQKSQEPPVHYSSPVSRRTKKEITVESIQNSQQVATVPVARKGRGKATARQETDKAISPVKETKTAVRKKQGRKDSEEGAHKEETPKRNSRPNIGVSGDVLGLPETAEIVRSSRGGRGKQTADNVVPEGKPAAKGRRVKGGNVEPNIPALSVVEPAEVKSSKTGRGKPKAEVQIVEPEVKPAAKGRRGKQSDPEPVSTVDVAEPVEVKSSRAGRGKPKAEVKIVEPEMKPAAKGRRGKSNVAERVSTVVVTKPVADKSSIIGRGKAAVTTVEDIVTVNVAAGKKQSKNKFAETIVEAGSEQVNTVRSRRGAPANPPTSPMKQEPVKKTAANGRKQLQSIQGESLLEVNESPAKRTATTTNGKRKRNNPIAMTKVPEEKSAPAKKSRGKATNEPVAEVVSVLQTGRKGRSKAQPEKDRDHTADLIADKIEAQTAMVKASVAAKGGKRKQADPTAVLSPKAGTKRAQRKKDTEAVAEAVPTKRIKRSASPAKAATASSAKQTRAGKLTVAAPKKGSVEIFKLGEVSRSTRGRRK